MCVPWRVASRQSSGTYYIRENCTKKFILMIAEESLSCSLARSFAMFPIIVVCRKLALLRARRALNVKSIVPAFAFGIYMLKCGMKMHRFFFLSLTVFSLLFFFLEKKDAVAVIVLIRL